MAYHSVLSLALNHQYIPGFMLRTGRILVPVLHFEATPNFPKPEINMNKGNIEIIIIKKQLFENNLDQIT